MRSSKLLCPWGPFARLNYLSLGPPRIHTELDAQVMGACAAPAPVLSGSGATSIPPAGW